MEHTLFTEKRHECKDVGEHMLGNMLMPEQRMSYAFLYYGLIIGLHAGLLKVA